MYILGFCECVGRTGSAVSLGSTYDADVGITGGRACVSRPSLPSQDTIRSAYVKRGLGEAGGADVDL